MSSNFIVNRICEHCGNTFTAKTTVTRFCSKICNNRNHKKRLREAKVERSAQEVKQVINHRLDELRTQEFLTVKAAAKLLGASEKILHGMIKAGRLKATNLSVRKTVISRADIDGLFDLPDRPDENKPNSSNLSDCCHIGEAQRLYNISEKALSETIKRNEVPKYEVGWYTYVLKSHLDKIFNPGGHHA